MRRNFLRNDNICFGLAKSLRGKKEHVKRLLQKRWHIHAALCSSSLWHCSFGGSCSGSLLLAVGYFTDSTLQRGKYGKIKRSAAAKDAFKREQPFPSTGRSPGACHGYVIDHVKALECGGADASNVQWQTTVEARAVLGEPKVEPRVSTGFFWMIVTALAVPDYNDVFIRESQLGIKPRASRGSGSLGQKETDLAIL